jgi:hypothetical protein
VVAVVVVVGGGGGHDGGRWEGCDDILFEEET